MIKSTSTSNTSARVIVVLAALFPLFAFSYMALVGTAPEQVLNSDLVQPYLIVRDFLADPSSIASWHLSPAIYVFPDYLIALVVSLLHVGPVFSMLVNGAILGVFLSLSGGFLLHAAGFPDLARAILITALAMFAAVLLGLALPGDLATDMQIWMLSTFIHSGSLLCGVTLIGLWTNAEITTPRHGRLYPVTLVLAGLASYSDLSVLVYFVVPLAIATGIAWLVTPSFRLFWRTWLLIAVAVAGYGVDRLTRGRIGPGGNFAIPENVANWMDILTPHLAGNPLLVIFLLFAPLMLARALFLVIAAWRRRALAPSEFIEITLAGVQAVAILVPALFGVFSNIWHLRYSLPIAFLPLVWLLVIARTWLARPVSFPHAGAVRLAAWAGACGVSALAGFAALPILTAEPPVTACMQRLGIDTAYAWYWDAKAPVFLSDYSIAMIQIEPDGRYSDWNTNDRWLTESVVDGSPVAARAIDMQGLDANSVEQIYGSPSRIETCGEVTFWLYDRDLPIPPR